MPSRNIPNKDERTVKPAKNASLFFKCPFKCSTSSSIWLFIWYEVAPRKFQKGPWGVLESFRGYQTPIDAFQRTRKMLPEVGCWCWRSGRAVSRKTNPSGVFRGLKGNIVGFQGCFKASQGESTWSQGSLKGSFMSVSGGFQIALETLLRGFQRCSRGSQGRLGYHKISWALQRAPSPHYPQFWGITRHQGRLRDYQD